MRAALDLSRRERRPELMDQPGLDPRRHAAALRGLERINRLSGSVGILWPAVRDLACREGPLRLLDVATGGGDVPIGLWLRARRAGLELHADGCDRSPTAVEHARRRARERGADVRFFAHDALAGPLPDGYDVVTCSLFLHHLDEGEAVQLLRNAARAAQRLLLVNDLERTLPGLLLAYVGTRVLSDSPIVHTDGPLSVRAAFTRSEALGLARRAGLEGATVERRWPFRYLLTWRR